MVLRRLSNVFEFKPTGINWPRGVLFLDVALVPLVFLWAIGRSRLGRRIRIVDRRDVR